MTTEPAQLAGMQVLLEIFQVITPANEPSEKQNSG